MSRFLVSMLSPNLFVQVSSPRTEQRPENDRPEVGDGLTVPNSMETRPVRRSLCDSRAKRTVGLGRPSRFARIFGRIATRTATCIHHSIHSDQPSARVAPGSGCGDAPDLVVDVRTGWASSSFGPTSITTVPAEPSTV